MSKFSDDMDAGLGIVNPHLILRRYKCPIITYSTQHAHAFGTTDRRAELTVIEDGKQKSKTFRPQYGLGATEARKTAYLQAVSWAMSNVGVSEWVPTGFPNSWMPKDAHTRMKADLQQWRDAKK